MATMEAARLSENIYPRDRGSLVPKNRRNVNLVFATHVFSSAAGLMGLLIRWRFRSAQNQGLGVKHRAR